ncbi:redoxin domain-containing protein [Pseudodesulfovibrio cashew]|uniref:Redoxin domain-containing protein n=1 Tax=Pseudodesulfovibrio cashew TaxID=2678688 RepID=A0A6I6J9X6_9BACT|nr:TlpA disulfide reductase family protein [Pseudodesulfovibrio cashew]QGY39626.1 redoxin domain-containing protein [Pseudodesulfovibrio cashew]
MKRASLFLLAVLVLGATCAYAGDPFPDLALGGKLDEDQRAYLGVASDSFKLSDIRAEYLFIEAYSMYCPICQRDAPHVNEAFEAIAAADKAGRIRFLGLALGNTPFEVEFYRKKYAVQFPLFGDEDYVIHKALGEVPTPAFYVVKLGPEPEILFKKVGEAEGTEALLQAIKEHTGI